MNVLNDDAMTRGVPILVFANKQDLPNAQKPSKIVEALGVQSLRNHKWHVQVYMIKPISFIYFLIKASCATTGEGLIEGMEIFAKDVKNFVKENKFG